LKTSWLTICCVQVVPDFDQVAIDIVVAELEIVPARRIHQEILDFARLARPRRARIRSCHPHPHVETELDTDDARFTTPSSRHLSWRSW
jgi:hypothetical protein